MKYRKKPVEIEAIKWHVNMTPIDVMMFLGESVDNIAMENNQLKIKTLEGEMKADEGDYIIKGVQGEIYPCKPDIFEKTYELVED